MYVNPSLQGDNNWVVMLLRHLVIIVEWWSSPLSLSLSLSLPSQLFGIKDAAVTIAGDAHA